MKQKLGSAVSKRLMKRAQVGDTQLVITNIDDLKARGATLKISGPSLRIRACVFHGSLKATPFLKLSSCPASLFPLF